MKNFKRVIAALLTVVMLFAMAPMAAIADDTDDTPSIQLESFKDPETGKPTLKVTLNVDKIKKGEISGLELNEIFGAVLGDKNVPGSGLISMDNLLKIFPIIYAVDKDGKATASDESVLDVVGATAIIGLDTIVGEYVDDLPGLIQKNIDVLSDPEQGIKMSRVMEAVSTNDTLRAILATYFDSTEERDLYLTEAGKQALAGVADKSKEQVLAELTADDYKNFFNNGYLNFDQIVADLLDKLLEAIASSEYKSMSDYLTTKAETPKDKVSGEAYVDTNKFDIVKYLLQEEKVTVEELLGHLRVDAANVKSIIGDDEKENFLNYTFAAFFTLDYLKEGKKIADLVAAIRSGSSISELAEYLDMAKLLEEGLGVSKEAVIEYAIQYVQDNTELIKKDSELSELGLDDKNLVTLIQDGISDAKAMDSMLAYFNVAALMSALGFKKDDIKNACLKDPEQGLTPANMNSNIDYTVVKEDYKFQLATVYNSGSDDVADYLPYLYAGNLVAKLYGGNFSAAADAATTAVVAATELVTAGSENVVLNYFKGNATLESVLGVVGLSKILEIFKIKKTNVYAALLKDDIVKTKTVDETTVPRVDDAAQVLDEYIKSTASDKFETLIATIMSTGDDNPFKNGIFSDIVVAFINEIEEGPADRKNAFETHAAKLIENNPTTYIDGDDIGDLFGSNLIYYFFKHVGADGKIGGNEVASLLKLDRVVALLDVTLSDKTTLKEKILSEYGYNNYLTTAGKDFVQSRVVTGVAAKKLDDLYSNYTIYFNINTLFAALVSAKRDGEHAVGSEGNKTIFTDIIFDNPQDYINVKGMNTILQYWLTEEGLDSKDMTNIIDTLKNATPQVYKTPNGEDRWVNGNKLLRNAVIKGISKFFTNAVDIVVDEKDIADTEPYPNRHLVLDGTALMERIYTCLLPTTEELDNIAPDGYLKRFNVVIRAQEDYYYWEEVEEAEEEEAEEEEKVAKIPPQAENGDLEYITLDVYVKLYLTGDLTGLKKQVQQHKDKIKSDFDFEYLYDYTYGLYKDGGTMKFLVGPDEYEDKTYSELTNDEKMTVNRYNKVDLVKGDDEIKFTLDLPYFLTFVYRNLAESDLSASIKEKLYDLVYNKTIRDLTSKNPDNRLTVDELYMMIDALDLDALMKDFYNDSRGREWLVLLFDFIGDEDLIMDWYKNGKPSTSVKDSAGNDSYYVNPEWTEENGLYVTAEWVWQALTHWKDLEQATKSRDVDIKEVAALLDALQKNKLFNKLLDRADKDPIDFSTMVNDDFHLPVGDFLGDVTIALDTSAHTLEKAFQNPDKTFKDVLRAFVKDEYDNIQNGLSKIFSKLPEPIMDSPIKDFYMGNSYFQTATDSSKNTYTALNEYKLINKNLKTALGSVWSDLTEKEVAEVVDGFVGNLQSARPVNVSAKQNGLYKVNFYGLDGTTKLLTTFLPKETDPAKAYQDPEVKTGYVFSGWSLTLGGARIDETPSYDVDLYPIYKKVDYEIVIAKVDASDEAPVTADLLKKSYQYEDPVSFVVTGMTKYYTLASIEYSIDNGDSYTTYNGTPFDMPAGNVYVKIHLKNEEVPFVPDLPVGIKGEVYTVGVGYPIVVTITTPGYEIDTVEYDDTVYKVDPDGKLKDSSGNELVAKVDELDKPITDIKITAKQINYTATLEAVTANDGATVSAAIGTSVVDPLDPTNVTAVDAFHYDDLVTLNVTSIKPDDYTVNYIEYSVDGGESYELYKEGTKFNSDVLVKVYLYAPVSFNMMPAGTTVTVNPTSVGKPIVFTGVTPGYEVTTVLYGGEIYKLDPDTGTLKDSLGNELVALNNVSDIKVTLSPIHYNITVTYSVPGVTGDLVSMTDKTVEETITLAVGALNTTAYKVSYITYRVKGSTTSTIYSAPFQMLPGDLEVTVYLTSTVTPTPTPSKPAYKIDDIEVTGDVAIGDDEVDATVSFDKTSYKPGDVVIVTVNQIEEGYELDYISIVQDGEETPVDGTYFIMPDGKIGVKVYTKRKTYEYSIAGVPDTGLYKDTISFTVTVGQGEVMKEIPEGCVLVSAKVGPNGEMELTYVFSLTENGKDVNYRIGDLSYRTLKIKNGVEWVDASDPTGENGSAFKGWSALVGETYLFASFEKTAKFNLWWLWIILILLILIALEVIFYRKDEKNGREKGGLWKVVRAIGDAFIALSKAFYGLFHRKKA